MKWANKDVKKAILNVGLSLLKGAKLEDIKRMVSWKIAKRRVDEVFGERGRE